MASALTTEPAAQVAREERPRRAPGRAAGSRSLSTLRQSTPDGLTRREQEVAALLARGLTNRQIAKELTITERTAETHVCKILSKLSLNRRAQLTAWAVEHDLALPRAG